MISMQEKIMNEAINFELNLSKTYHIFKELFPEDASFWKQLEREEMSHAAAILKIKPFATIENEIVDDLFHISLNELKLGNKELQSIINSFQQNPDRNKAFEIALEIEKKGIEVHYQAFINSDSDSELAKLFIALNGNDKNHASRITDYMNQSNIDIKS